MTLYAVISADAWTALTTTGRLTGRGDLIDPAFFDAYAWIRRVAARRGLGDAWPVWLWAKTTRYELVRQVRDAAREQPGSVLITARIHRSRLLLSEFQEWHSVLNHGPVLPADLAIADFDAYYDRLDEQGPGWRRPDTAAPHVRQHSKRRGNASSTSTCGRPPPTGRRPSPNSPSPTSPPRSCSSPKQP
jgi:hypothetical protein